MRFLFIGRTCLIALFNLLAALALMGFGPPKMVDRESGATIRLTPGELRQWYHAAQPPAVTADALIVYDVDAGRTLYSRNSEQRLPPASLTKLMTALLVLETENLSDEVTVAGADLVGGASMGLEDGEVVTVRDLLWGLLVASGNDAAATLARYTGGDAGGFVDMMNGRAQELGLDDTTFVNPHGLDAEGHVSSADDILTLTLRLLEFPLFREIVATRDALVAGHSLANTNEMLDLYPGVDGVKTGTTSLAGQCLVLSVNDGDRRLLIVVLGSEDRYADVASLHDLYRANYEWAQGDAEDLSVLNRLYDEDGEQIPLQAHGDPVMILRHRWGDPDVIGFRHVDVVDGASLERSQPVGTVVWRSGDDVVAQNELTVR